MDDSAVFEDVCGDGVVPVGASSSSAIASATTTGAIVMFGNIRTLENNLVSQGAQRIATADNL